MKRGICIICQEPCKEDAYSHLACSISHAKLILAEKEELKKKEAKKYKYEYVHNDKIGKLIDEEANSST